MQRVRFRDDGIARRYGRGEIAAGHAGKRERKIIRAEHYDRSDRLEARSNLILRVDGRERPRSLDRRIGGLPQLTRRARQLDIGQARRLRQRGFEVRLLDERRLAGFDAFGEFRQESRDRFGRRAAKLARGVGSRRQRGIAIFPPAERIRVGQPFAGRRVMCLECLRRLRGPPLAADENRMLSHKLHNHDGIPEHADGRDLRFRRHHAHEA